MSVAGIWETWHAGMPEERRSFSLLTTAANEFMHHIHDRMPVILDRADEDPWLDPEVRQPERLQRLLKPCPNSWLSAVPVSPLVNAGKNNTPDVLRPSVNEANQQCTFGF